MDLEVKVIEDGGLGEQLGITRERFEILADGMSDARISCKTIAEELAMASKIAVHPNELAFICYSIGRIHEMDKNPLTMLASALSRFSK